MRIVPVAVVALLGLSPLFAARGDGDVGLRLRRTRGRMTAHAVLPDGPAARAGIRPGDRIIAVDGALVQDRPLRAVASGLRGEPGTEVALEVESRSGEKRSVTLVREVPTAEALRSKGWRLGERTHHISGVGVRLKRSGGGITIAEVLPASPAREHGVERGDVIVEADGRSLSAADLERAASLIRGKPGTRVRLKLERDGKSLRDLDLMRRAVFPMHPNPLRRRLKTKGGDGEGCDDLYWSSCSCDDGCAQDYCESECTLEVEDHEGNCWYDCSECYCSACA